MLDELLVKLLSPAGQRLSAAYAETVRNMLLTCDFNIQTCRACTINKRCTKARYRDIVR